jgi:hypothetical protein
MSLRLPAAAVRAYDALKMRPGASLRRSDARDPALVNDIGVRLRELIATYRISGHDGPGGATYVFWSEILREIESGAFDDLLDRL